MLRIRISSIQYKHKIFIVILLFALLPFLFFCTFYIAKSWDEKVQFVLDKNSSQLKLAAEQTNILLKSEEFKAAYVNNNSQINMFLENGFIDDLTFNMSFNNNLNDLFTALNADDQGIKVTIFTNDNSYYNGNYIQKIDRLILSIPDTEKNLKERILNLKGNDAMWIYRKSPTGEYNWNKGEECLCYYKPIMSLTKVLAIIEVKIPFDKIRKQANLDIPEGSFIIYDTEAGVEVNILKNSSKQVDISNVIDNYFSSGDKGSYYVISENVVSASHRMIMFIPKTYILQNLKNFMITAFLLVALLIILLVFIVEYVSKHLTKRLSKLIEKMNTNFEDIIENDNNDIITTDDDIGKITKKVYELVQKVKVYYIKVSAYENEKIGLELEILQSRINPHFLYNTLSTMKWKCHDEKLAEMIDTMVRYYRLSLNKGDTILKISDEMKMIEEYLKLQKFAFESDFIYTFQIEEQVYEHTIIKHLLQPIVENAILHGINGIETGGILTIIGNIQDGKITFRIMDNGVGISAEIMEQLLDVENQKQTGGYGIKNVQKRIWLFYGSGYGIKVESTEGKGTTVIMTIPAEL